MPPLAVALRALLLVIAIGQVVSTKGVKLSESFGGPYGTQFSDEASVVPGQTVRSITLRAAKRVDAISLNIVAPTEKTFTHGGTGGGGSKTLTLGVNEYITSMEAHWAKKRGHTRIFYVNFGTSEGNSISGGTTTENSDKVTAPEGYQLGGFFGRDGDEIDLLGAIWTSIEDEVAETDSSESSSSSQDPDEVAETGSLESSSSSQDTDESAETDSSESSSSSQDTDEFTLSEDIQLSEVFGGPHGYAFSDISSVVLGQKLSSVTIRGAERVDAVALQVISPAQKTMSHGGSGGTEHVLTLQSGEYINSMEVHVAKESRHTRVFYLKLGTSAGNSVSAGTKTSDSASVKAPKGFQLSGFFGRSAGELDQIGIIWTRRSAKPLLLKDVMGKDWYGKTIRNWVGPTIGDASDSACYRDTKGLDSNSMCPLGYNDDEALCTAQCPLSYPVSCFAECIPQNDDCTLEIVQKVTAVASAAINVATAGLFGAIFTSYKKATTSFLCASNMVSLIRNLIYYLRFQQTTAPQGEVEELLAVAYQSDVVLFDIPIAVCNCLGIDVPANAKFGQVVTIIVQNIVKQAIINGEAIVSSAQNVLNLLKNVTVINATDTSVDELQDFIDSKSSCGYRLKNLTDYVISSVNKIRTRSPDVILNDIRVEISNSSLVMTDIPTVTNNCMKELLATKTTKAAFETRDLLRKTFGVIIEQLITTATTDKGQFVAESDYMLEVANMGLTVLAGFDPTRISWVASQFLQPTCGPTAFIGEIDDGMLADALGLTTVGEAFAGSYGWWMRKGDGVVNLIFESIDSKDVTVVIHSGGKSIKKVKVDAGETVTWNSTVSKLQDKTLYLDRWRPNIVGLPGKGGGSLVLWVPRASEGGHLTMRVRINVS